MKHHKQKCEHKYNARYGAAVLQTFSVRDIAILAPSGQNLAILPPLSPKNVKISSA